MKRKLFSGFLSMVLCASMTLSVFAGETDVLQKQNAVQKAGSKAEVTITGSKISIGNGYLTREYGISNGKVLTDAVINNRIGSTLSPQEGSEDFVINTIPDEEGPDGPVTEVFPQKALDKSNWTVSIKNSAQTAFPEASAKKLVDGDINTYPDEYTISGHPFTIDINLGEKKEIRSMSVDKRPGYTDAAYGINGTMGKFELYVSEDGANYSLACAGEFTEQAYQLHEEGNLYNVGKTVYANVKTSGGVQYVRLVQKSCSLGSAQEFTSAELGFYEDAYTGYDWTDNGRTGELPDAIYASDLTYEGAEQANIENGKKLTIHYAPYEKDGVSWDIDQVVVVKDDEHYMRSFLEISVSNEEKAAIDYIDTDRFVLSGEEDGIWCHPDDSSISSMWIGKHELMLGQPVYAEGMFLGCEFPANDNIINDNQIQIRYYSGKNFSKLKEDGQLTTDGKFVTWQNVIGAAEGTDTSVVQTAFFSYIENIATPTKFRKQYNSWYDNMMTITDESIANSFYGAESGLSSNGVEPLDCYVVDDGWNTYYYDEPDSGLAAVSPGSTQGTTPNRTGFWEFNAKFPNELYTSASLSDKLQSCFGLWVGPQGGYNYYNTFAKFLEYKGTGEVQSNSALGQVICTGSRTYLKNFEAMALDYQKRFGIDYWKWDGFASRPCNSKSHNHMTGGTDNMYFTSDMWEAWTDLFDHVRAQRAAEGKGLFINATCYVNLSPWLLQWVNTIWVQDSGDTGHLGTGERHQQKIYYRDQVYYQLYKRNQIQFPLKNIYNHDPIYGVSDNSSATTEVFREFLFANAVRGTAFWELYYSPSIMDEDKWMVTADALAWAEDNHEILKNAKLFGNQPSSGVYGYSCWNKNEGIVSFTNPLDTQQTYELQITDVIGADKTLSNAAGTQVHPYAEDALDAVSYGDTITVTLEPHQTIIRQYGLKDTTAPELVSAKITGENEVTLKFSERIGNGSYTINEESVTAELKADYRTVLLKTESSLTDGASVLATVHDMTGNEGQAECRLSYYKDSVIGSIDKLEGLKRSYDAISDITWLKDIKQQYTAEAGTFEGTTDFTVSTGVKTTSDGVLLVSLGNDVSVSINKDGFAEFKVKSVTLDSKETVTTVTEKAHGTFGTDEYVPTAVQTELAGKVNDGKEHTITAVREVNGLLKLYIDGKLCKSAYNKAHLNESVDGGTIQIADNHFSGDLAEVKVLNYALEYNEIPEIVEPVPFVSPSHERWTAKACSECSASTGDANAMAAIDGNPNSWWHTNYSGGDNCTSNGQKHWIEVSFNKAETFSKFLYTGRGSKTNGSMLSYKLELMDEAGDYTTVIENGSFSASETANVIDLGRDYTAYGLRLTCLSTQNSADFAAAVEIDVASENILLTTQALEAVKAKLLEKANDFRPETYTAETAQAVTELLETIGNTERATSLAMAQLESMLDTAIKNLVEKPEDLLTQEQLETAKNALLEKVKDLDLNVYTTETAAEVTKILEIIKNTDSATSEKMQQLEEQLDAAIKALKKKDINDNDIVKPCSHIEVKTIVPATMDADGKTAVTCKLCGKQLREEIIPKVQSIDLQKQSYTYDGKSKMPLVILKDSKGNEIASSNYTIAYPKTAKNVGKYTVIITLTGNYTGSASRTFTIVPKATKLTQLKAKSKAISVKWKKQTKEITGYQIQCSLKKNFAKKNTSTFTFKKNVKSATLKKLKGSKKYFVRIRTYKQVSKTKYYSAWSAVKQVKTKK